MVVLDDSQMERGGDVLDSQIVVACRVDDGKITEAWSIPPDQAAENAFWG